MVDADIAVASEDPSQLPVATPPVRHYHEAYPTGPPVFPVQPPQYTVEPANVLPPWVWIMVGMLLATVFTRIMNFVSHPKEAMTEMMMKQMMSQMSNAQGTPPPPPFGGAVPPSANPFGMATPPAYDTTAQPSTPAAAAPQMSPKTSTSPPPSPPPVSPFNPAGSKESNPQKNGVQTPSAVKTDMPPTPSPPPASPSFFQDVPMEQTTEQPVVENPDEAVDYMFDMLRDPQMRESLVQFLPENMRSPEMLENLMSSPMVKEQFKSMMTPQLLQQIKVSKSPCNNFCTRLWCRGSKHRRDNPI